MYTFICLFITIREREVEFQSFHLDDIFIKEIIRRKPFLVRTFGTATQK